MSKQKTDVPSNARSKEISVLKGIRSTNPIAVGDYVQIIINNEGTAFISEIEDRKNYIIRRASNLSKQSHILAANLDQCMLIVTINYPETSTIFIDRFLATAEAYRVPVKLIFNKTDRYNEDDTRYMDAPDKPVPHTSVTLASKVSALNNIGTDEVKKRPGREGHFAFRQLRSREININQRHFT